MWFLAAQNGIRRTHYAIFISHFESAFKGTKMNNEVSLFHLFVVCERRIIIVNIPPSLFSRNGSFALNNGQNSFHRVILVRYILKEFFCLEHFPRIIEARKPEFRTLLKTVT